MRRRYGKQPRPTRCSKRPAHRPGVSGSSSRLPWPRAQRSCVSLVLDLPRLTGTFRGYPDDAAVVARARSPLAQLLRSPGRPPAGHSRKPGPPVAGDRRLQTAVRRARGGSAAWDRSARFSTRRARGRPRRRRAVDRAARAEGVAQSHHGRRGRARPRAPPERDASPSGRAGR